MIILPVVRCGVSYEWRTMLRVMCRTYACTQVPSEAVELPIASPVVFWVQERGLLCGIAERVLLARGVSGDVALALYAQHYGILVSSFIYPSYYLVGGKFRQFRRESTTPYLSLRLKDRGWLIEVYL